MSTQFAITDELQLASNSPFAALGSIFGGQAEELSFQDFEPGSAELQAGGTNLYLGRTMSGRTKKVEG